MEQPRSRGIDYSKFDKIEDSDDEKPLTSSTAKPGPTLLEKPSCHGCGKEISKPLRCSQCQKVVYCSAQCQRSDWAYHKRGCKKAEDPKAEKVKADSETKPDPSVRKEVRRKKEEKVVDKDEDNLTWYRHREWKPTSEPKKEFIPTPLSEGAAEGAAMAAGKPADGSAWNAAGTWEDRDVTEFAKQTLKGKLTEFATLDCAGGALEVEEVSNVDGDASKPVIRGKRRHMFDMSFKLKFVFKWMDSSGQRNAKGTVEVTDFTNDVFTDGADARPEVRLSFADARLLDAGRKQAVEAALGVAEWPPVGGSLMAQLAEKLKIWVKAYESAE